MCVLLMPQFILFFASFGEDQDKGRHKLETTGETRGNATEPCSAPRSPPLSLPSSSLHGAAPSEELKQRQVSGTAWEEAAWVWQPSNSSKKGKYAWKGTEHEVSSAQPLPVQMAFASCGFSPGVKQRSLPFPSGELTPILTLTNVQNMPPQRPPHPY